MEVSVFEVVGLNEGSVLSVRAGNTRRQAPIPLQGPLRFPNLPFNAKQFKLDIMQTLGSAKCEIKGAKELESYSVTVDMNDGGQARIGFSVREQPNLCGKRAGELKQVDKTQDGGENADPTMASAEKAWAATDTRTYARDHNIPNFVQEMLQMVLREKPDAPFTVMAEYLQKKAIELGESTGNEATIRPPPQSQKTLYSYNASIPQASERTLPMQDMKTAPSLPPRGGTRQPFQTESFQHQEGMLQQKSAPQIGGLKQQPSAYYQPQKGMPAAYEDSGAMPQKRYVSHQLPADGDKSHEEDYGLGQITTKHKMKRMGTSALENLDPDDGDGEFYVPKLERLKEHDDSSSYGGGPDGYVPKVSAEGFAKDQYGDVEASYAKAAKPRSANEVARLARAGEQHSRNQKSQPPGRRPSDRDYGAAPQVPMKRDDGGEPHQSYKRGVKSLPGSQKAAYRSARVNDDPERAQLEAEHMALQAERASLLHDLSRLNQKVRR
eukprot:CAMPEP_0172727894 /NCGR_PEP_ID=MMETSP1074-20121228/91931_1 /TAXON_ID=2916 /ORGANISM="Ceratium fusus, Strain PA161109" /LENGTH=493 /DNA_ID=CAMNT_0013555085 /DNA_START=75 /DNA_END=1556 /DNA_ORIENTATION=-